MNLLKFLCPEHATIQESLVEFSLDELRTRTSRHLHLWCGDCRAIHRIPRAAIIFVSAAMLAERESTSSSTTDSETLSIHRSSSAYFFAARTQPPVARG